MAAKSSCLAASLNNSHLFVVFPLHCCPKLIFGDSLLGTGTQICRVQMVMGLNSSLQKRRRMVNPNLGFKQDGIGPHQK